VDIVTIVGILIVIAVLIMPKLIRTLTFGNHSATAHTPHESIAHRKKDYLATRNEQKLYFALQKALDKKYVVHCQTSLIALVEPVEYKHRKRAWSKRMDYVITDTATKIVAVIELDDASHSNAKRIARDDYVNDALQNHHPLIRIPTMPFYKPELIAEILEEQAGISSIFKRSATIINIQTGTTDISSSKP